jgi:2-keto-4-pentenoate hydratase/2-oxohepta-3-ene-1,7-dioic acid hydratase in catechol pathway
MIIVIVRFESEGKVLMGTCDGQTITSGNRNFDISAVKLLAPACPSKIVCIGLNYAQHAAELKMALPQEPIIFLKPPTAAIGPGAEIVFPPSSQQVDYEGELAVVIRNQCKNVPASEAELHILGYTCFNDVTARDLQRRDGQWTRAKSFDTFAPFGPWVAGIDSVDSADLDIQTRVNGEVKQSSNTSDLIFDVPRLVEFISHIMTLEPGDVIATGTPPGVGPLRRGDVVEVEIERIGVLKNSVAL